MPVKSTKGKQSTPLYKLKSEDGQFFQVERGPMKFSAYINKMFIDYGVNDRNCAMMDPILVPFPGKIVELVIQWLYHHRDDPSIRLDSQMRYNDFDPWDKQFFKVESGVLFTLLNASHALGVEDLMNMGCAAAAELIRGKSIEEIRKIYGIRSDEEQLAEALANGGEGTSAMTFTAK